jgi:hypothetical protein
VSLDIYTYAAVHRMKNEYFCLYPNILEKLMSLDVFTMTLETSQCNDSLATSDKSIARYVPNAFTLENTAVGSWRLSAAHHGLSKDDALGRCNCVILLHDSIET